MNTHAALGFEFDPPPVVTDATPDRDRAVFRVRKTLENFVYDTVALEGNPFTFPEVKTLMDGVTVGGRRVADAAQVLDTAESWRELLRRVSDGTFDLSAATACELQAMVAREEALECGTFRTGHVGIAGTDRQPPPADTLAARYDAGRECLESFQSVHARAIGVFLFLSADQFFWDGNKRTGRLLMNGVLLSAGMDAIAVPARRQQEFNEAMIRFYDTSDAAEAIPFLVSCSLDRTLRIGDAPASDGHDG